MRASERVDGGIYKEPSQGFIDEVIEEVSRISRRKGSRTFSRMILVLAGRYASWACARRAEINSWVTRAINSTAETHRMPDHQRLVVRQ